MTRLWAIALLLVGSVQSALTPPNYQALYLRCSQQVIGVQADVVEGKLVELSDVVKKFEAANPGQTLNATTFKVEAKATK